MFLTTGQFFVYLFVGGCCSCKFLYLSSLQHLHAFLHVLIYKKSDQISTRKSPPSVEVALKYGFFTKATKTDDEYMCKKKKLSKKKLDKEHAIKTYGYGDEDDNSDDEEEEVEADEEEEQKDSDFSKIMFKDRMSGKLRRLREQEQSFRRGEAKNGCSSSKKKPQTRTRVGRKRKKRRDGVSKMKTKKKKLK